MASSSAGNKIKADTRRSQRLAPAPSSLASVVRIETWPKVHGGHPLALFHMKFWGKSMADEEAEWQKKRTHIGGHPDDGDEDGNEAMGEGEGKDDGKAVDEDEGNDGDIIPGCYVFDIDIEAITPRSLWICPDYIRIYEALQDYYEEYVKPMTRAPSAVLTGQPGVGQSRCFVSSV
jgi:hypothetical protein